MKLSSTLILLLFVAALSGQSKVSGKLLDADQNPIGYANVVLYDTNDDLVKVASTEEDGRFNLPNIIDGKYYLIATFIGYSDLRYDDIQVQGQPVNIPDLIMDVEGIELETAVVTARRAIVEVKPDRTVFNVEGTINSAGDNGLGLLRKAPGVLVDNNNNVSVLGRSGVLIYVDGKRLPLTGEDLTAYLENLPAEQIDRMDIITNPGAKYEAQGNAGIIDIRLKKDKNLGSNGSVSGSYSMGREPRSNVNASGNYRNKLFNSFATIGAGTGANWNIMKFQNFQNGLFIDEENESITDYDNVNFRWGTDFFISKNQTIGFLVSGNYAQNQGTSLSESRLALQNTPENIDSILVAENLNESNRNQNTFNINYVYQAGNKSLNIDLDYGRFRNDAFTDQPNTYFNPERTMVISNRDVAYDTPVDIDIYTAKLDYETNFAGGKLGFGSKYSKVETDNTFLFFDVDNGTQTQNDRRSNQFIYDEQVYAGYVNYNRTLSEKWNMSAGLRVEQTDAIGTLTAFIEELQEDPVEFDYTSFFPNIGITYQAAPMHAFALNYGRRINRPDYNVLNPFREQLSELSFSKGNAFLRPEIVNNIELGYTLQYRYNFKLSYSRTNDQITRLIGPDEEDPRAGFITWDNLAKQTIYAGNISAPVAIKSWWNAYFNLNVSYLDNQADYGDGAIVDVQAWAYNIYQQHTFNLPNAFVGEIGGWFSGPGVWGGVFRYDPSYSLNIGLQRKFFNNSMNVRLSAQDVFFQAGWSGESEFNGLVGTGMGNWDSQRVSLSISYNFGNNNVKSRKRKTGIEDETSRIGEGD